MKKIIPLNKEQIALVEENVSVVDLVVFSKIIYNNNVFGLEYDDLFQEGALLLCKAAMKYDKSRNCSFKAFAYRVVLNGLISYCKKTNNKKRKNSEYIEELKKTPKESVSYEEILYDKMMKYDTLLFLGNIKDQYPDTVRLGIESLMWKIKGYSVADIAMLYGHKSNYIGACISRALKKLQENSVFNLYMEDFLDEKASKI